MLFEMYSKTAENDRKEADDKAPLANLATPKLTADALKRAQGKSQPVPNGGFYAPSFLMFPGMPDSKSQMGPKSAISARSATQLAPLMAHSMVSVAPSRQAPSAISGRSNAQLLKPPAMNAMQMQRPPMFRPPGPSSASVMSAASARPRTAQLTIDTARARPRADLRPVHQQPPSGAPPNVPLPSKPASSMGGPSSDLSVRSRSMSNPGPKRPNVMPSAEMMPTLPSEMMRLRKASMPAIAQERVSIARPRTPPAPPQASEAPAESDSLSVTDSKKRGWSTFFKRRPNGTGPPPAMPKMPAGQVRVLFTLVHCVSQRNLIRLEPCL